MNNTLAALFVLAGLGSGVAVQAQNGPPDSVRAAQIHTRVNEVLSAPEFAPLKTRNEALERVGKSTTNYISRFFEWLGRLFRFGSGGSERSTSIALYPLMAVLIAGLAYIAAYVVLRKGKLPKTKKSVRRSKSTVLDLERDDSRDASEWLDAARNLEADRDYLQALRAVFVATLLRLDAAGLITYEPYKTNGEYLRATRKAPDFYGCFQGIVRSFDAGWYGSAAVTKADFNVAMEGYKQADALAVKAHEA